jgi:hypothetical protein
VKHNPENLKDSWINKGLFGSVAPSGDPEYVNLWIEHFKDFSGKVLEIGAGTGYLAKNILGLNNDIDYSILDIESHFAHIKQTLHAFDDVKYIKSSEYKKIFDEEWDLLIETHCLSETPVYYYTDILENISTKNCFVIDYGGDPNDLVFEKMLTSWFEKFPSCVMYNNTNLAGARPDKGIPVYIGKRL